ncbi:autotransporter outer membrane beta-barrel domain-containing protein [Pseudomonas mandelii]|uniref:autotransporter outer membrane beta-barrel domain-containing protein n=1 Tax=Pseudomonas mandelii TaxID=75612 RepID=UPI00209D6981|nr:autotransporter outer membrane beta-barrel domain-containing protein [Pseudomonas mandelii]MCO8309847.1 autotransporter outer membrane beta-barrel domain-containing protein [Pseudomonas mandelii]
MPIRHTFRPHYMALAIALALGHAGSALAQQPAGIPSPADQMARIEAFIKHPDTFATKVTKTESGPEGIALKLGDTNDLVTVSGRGRFNGLVDGGGGENVLQLDVANGGEFGESRNFHSLHIKRGQWTLTGTDDFRDGAVVMGNAALTNRGRIVGPVSVDKRATFRGNGHVGHLLVAGRLEVNALHGAPQVTGNLELHNSAELAYEVNADGRSETIKVIGTASLGDATLKIVAVPGEYPITSEYRVIEAGKVEGRFDKVLNDLAFMTPTPHYEEEYVSLTYARNDVALESIAITENGRELAHSIVEPERISQTPAPSKAADATVSAPTPSPATIPSTPLNAAVTALLGSSKATATYAIEQLAGGSNANLANATLSSVNPVSNSMLSAMRQLDNADLIGQNRTPRLATDSEANGRVWLQALGSGGTLDRSRGSSTLQHSTKGLVLGADWALDEQWRVGVIGGQSQTRLDGSQLDGDLDSWHLGAYALRQSGPLALRLGASHSNHDGSTKRRVAFNGFSDRPKGRYDANTQQAFAELGYNLGSGTISAEPFASFGYQRYQRDSYTEKGGAAALQVHGQMQNNFSSTFGLRLAQFNTLDNGMQLTPRFSAGWKHIYGDVDSKTQQRLATGGKNYIIEGAALDRDNLMLDAGLDLAVSTRQTLGVGYNGEIGNDSRSHGVMGQWRMAF